MPLATVAELQQVSGASGDYGFVRYAEASGQAALALSPGSRTAVTMTVDPSQTLNTLTPAFAGQPLWDGTTLHTPRVNDAHLIRFAMSATASVAGGSLKLEAVLVSSGAVLESKDALLPNAAATLERVAFDLTLFAGATYVASGVQFYLTSTVPASVQNETLVVIPLRAGL